MLIDLRILPPIVLSRLQYIEHSGRYVIGLIQRIQNYRDCLLSPENKAPQFDTLPMRFVFPTRRIRERRMRCSPRNTRMRIVALDQQALFRRLLPHVPPLVLVAVPDIVRLPNEVGVDAPGW